MPSLATLVAILELACKDRAQLALENAALHHQLAVLKRSVDYYNASRTHQSLDGNATELSAPETPTRAPKAACCDRTSILLGCAVARR